MYGNKPGIPTVTVPTVRDLIDKLKKRDQNARVYLSIDGGETAYALHEIHTEDHASAGFTLCVLVAAQEELAN